MTWPLIISLWAKKSRWSEIKELAKALKLVGKTGLESDSFSFVKYLSLPLLCFFAKITEVAVLPAPEARRRCAKKRKINKKQKTAVPSSLHLSDAPSAHCEHQWTPPLPRCLRAHTNTCKGINSLESFLRFYKHGVTPHASSATYFSYVERYGHLAWQTMAIELILFNALMYSVWVYQVLSNHSLLIGGHLGCFRFFPMIDAATLSLCTSTSSL